MKTLTMTSMALAAAAAASPASAVFDATMQSWSSPATSVYCSLQGLPLDIAATSYNFPFTGAYTNSGYVNEFGSITLDKTSLVSTVYRVTSPTSVGAINLLTNDLVFAYTIRLVEASTNTVQSMNEFQVGLVNFGAGARMDGSAVKGRGIVTPAGGVALPLGGNGADLEILGPFGASLDWQWAAGSANQLLNNQTITLLMFTSPRPVVQGIGNFRAPPGQQAGVDPLASNAPVWVPAVPAPGPGLLLGLAGGALMVRRRREA